MSSSGSLASCPSGCRHGKTFSITPSANSGRFGKPRLPWRLPEEIFSARSRVSSLESSVRLRRRAHLTYPRGALVPRRTLRQNSLIRTQSRRRCQLIFRRLFQLRVQARSSLWWPMFPPAARPNLQRDRSQPSRFITLRIRRALCQLRPQCPHLKQLARLLPPKVRSNFGSALTGSCASAS